MLCLHAACRSRYFVRHLLCMNAKSGHQTSDFRTSDIERRSRTGDPCFAIVTQYESYKVTVFVWGKRKHSAVSCCCLQCSQEVSWWYAQILLPYQKTKKNKNKTKKRQGRWQEMNSQPPSLTFQHHFFHEIRTPTENKHPRLVEKGMSQIWTPMKLPQLAKRV